MFGTQWDIYLLLYNVENFFSNFDCLNLVCVSSFYNNVTNFTKSPTWKLQQSALVAYFYVLVIKDYGTSLKSWRLQYCTKIDFVIFHYKET